MRNEDSRNCCRPGPTSWRPPSLRPKPRCHRWSRCWLMSRKRGPPLRDWNKECCRKEFVMNSRRVLNLAAAIGLAALTLPAVSVSAPEKSAETEAVQVLAQGPVHEAYAQPVNTQADAATIVTKPPPDAIEELPPDQRPEGDRVQWIPGYWAWDADQGDYLWVSGSWRMPPPGRRWLPGHWQEVDTGWGWGP